MVYWSGDNVNTQIGFNSTSLGEVELNAVDHRYLGISATNGFFYNDGAFNILVSPDKLTIGWYVITMMMHDGEILGSIQIKDSVEAYAFTIPNEKRANNVTIQANGPNDKIKALKYLSYKSDGDKLLIPHLDGSMNFHTAIRMNVDGVSTIAHIPANYNNKEKNKFVVYFHGAGSLADNLWRSENQRKILKSLLDDGYVVIASDYSPPLSWGETQSQADTKALISHYKKYLNLENQPYVYATSMGGIVALNAIQNKAIFPKAVVMLYPVTNLEYMYQSGFKEQIKDAYSIILDSEFQKKTNGYDALNDNDGSSFANVPMQIYASYQDTLVSRIENTDRLRNKVNAVGGSVNIIDTVGEHGDISNIQPEEVIRFLSNY